MSIVRVGLGETAKFAEGYEAIFGKKKPAKKSKPTKKKTPRVKRRKVRKK
jgi:hypothetical protein